MRFTRSFTGCLCLMTEIFILPGFVIFGLGGALILASIVLASQTFFIPQNEYQLARLQNSLVALSVAVTSLIGAIWVLNHSGRRARPFCRNVLAPPEGEDHQPPEMLVDLWWRGVAWPGTHAPGPKPARPALRITWSTWHRSPTGELIARDSQVVVMEVHGIRVVVRMATVETLQRADRAFSRPLRGGYPLRVFPRPLFPRPCECGSWSPAACDARG